MEVIVNILKFSGASGSALELCSCKLYNCFLETLMDPHWVLV